MPQFFDGQLSTGLKGLDRIIDGVMPGDNFVWQMDSVGDYRLFVRFLLRNAREKRSAIDLFSFCPA